ncbi:MAG TPA: rhamnan synthesis F family protein [Bacteroidia bacterium]|jgi:lipopolysaccharide biosynthesis protein|nr:rhamnan synthesis F family protein [Bacteroidia bacterium]
MNNEQSQPRITAFIHVYYPALFSELLPYLEPLKNYATRFYFHLGSNFSLPQAQDLIQPHFPDCLLLQSPNTGKDIGGKLALLELYRQLEDRSDYMVLIHDKLSPQLLDGDTWRNQLLRILEPQQVQAVIRHFETNPLTGIIGAAEHISNEFKTEEQIFHSTNNALLKTYIRELGLHNTDFRFIAGNIFWVRSTLFETFFTAHPPLFLRSRLEPGNVSDAREGTHTHTLERVFSWIALDQGYTINGI